MREKKLYIVIIVLICFLTISLISAYRYNVPPKERETYPTPPKDDTLRIAFIGDSWAFIHQNEHKCHIPNIIERSCRIPTKIYSYGFPGRTTKEVYEAIFEDKEQKNILQKYGYSFCIISAGINDANKKMSVNYYRNSMNCIIRFLLANDVHPIILEIPDYDIQKAYSWQRRDRKLLYRISMIINQVPMECKQIYRDALNELCHDKNYQEKVSIIKYKTWNKEHEKDQNTLYRIDGIHLNNKGNSILDSVIAKTIISKIKGN